MDKDTYLYACAGALFQYPCGRSGQLLDWPKCRFTPNLQSGLVNKKAAAGTRELIAFIGSLSAMQKGIILALGINFLYGIFGLFVSALTALLFAA